jgi:hypothetical protein
MFLRQCVEKAVLIGDGLWLELMKCAESGDDDVIRALDEISDAFLNRGSEIPAFVRTYIAKRRRGHIRPRGGKSMATNFCRDNSILVLVQLLLSRFGPLGLKPTRYAYERRSRPRSHPRAPSACSIAHRALSEARVFGGDEGAVNKIWERGFRKNFGTLAGFLGPTLAQTLPEQWQIFIIAMRAVRKLPAPQ